jgi:hypothetical protein
MSVHTAMLQPPEDQRMAVSRVRIEGLPSKEAARALDIPLDPHQPPGAGSRCAAKHAWGRR